MISVENAKKGMEVVYIPRHLLGKSEQMKNRERGIITSFNDTYIFVRFGDELQSKACRPIDLFEWACDCDIWRGTSMACVQHSIQ